jgi:hypothetical protein
MCRRREEVFKLRAQMAKHVCRYEVEAMADGRSEKPCWKGEWEKVDVGLSHFVDTFHACGDSREDGWCEPCEEREKLRPKMLEAARSLGALRAALTRAAIRLAAKQPQP